MKLKVVISVMVLALVVSACGDSSDGPGTTAPPPSGTTSLPPGGGSNARSGTATVTIGGETWNLGEFICTFQATGLDFGALGSQGDMYLDMRSENDSHLTMFGDFTGEGWESTAEVIVSGKQVSVSGEFRHLDTDDLEVGTVSGTCN